MTTKGQPSRQELARERRELKIDENRDTVLAYFANLHNTKDRLVQKLKNYRTEIKNLNKAVIERNYTIGLRDQTIERMKEATRYDEEANRVLHQKVNKLQAELDAIRGEHEG